MFSKKQRLVTTEISNIFESNLKSEHSDFFWIKKRENNLNYSRFAIIVSKKVYNLAVQRHFIKRKIISVIKKLKNLPNKDYVLNLKRNISSLNSEDLTKELAKILN